MNAPNVFLKTKSMVALLLSFLATNICSHAALIVQNGQISAGQYDFVLPASQLYFTEASQMGGALQSMSNFDWGHEDWIYEGNPALTQYLAANPGASTAEMVLAWDFSQSDYRPISVDLYTRTFIFSGDATAALSWSTSGLEGSYTTIASFNFPGAYLQTDNVTIPANSTSFFVKIQFEDSTGTFDFQQNQWARAYGGYPPDPAPGVSALFTVASVPEPHPAMLVALAILGMGLLYFRRVRLIRAA